MALQVWLPLDGSLENKGCANAVITNNGATVNSAGKIGKCYSFDGSDDLISINSKKLYEILGGGSQPFSITLWVYRADETRAILFGDYQISPITDKNFVNLELSTSNTILFYWGNGNGYDKKLDFSAVVLNQWNHITVTYDGSKLKGYLNGELKQTANASLYSIGKTSGEYRLGRDNRTGTTVLNGKLNDFRIYDHCLSAAEVHEISQGLVLHYKLDGFNGGARENLLRTTPKSYAKTTYLAYKFDFTENLSEGQTYTIQLWDVDIAHSGKTADTLSVAGYWGGGYINLFDFRGTSYLTNGHADYLTKTFTITASQASGNGASNAWLEIYNSPSRADGTMSMTIEKWKLEKGSKPTPFIESYIDSGVDTTTISDSSGYGRDGKILNIIQLDENSPRYSTSMNLVNGNSMINCGRSAMVTDSITVNIWAYITTWGNLVSCTEGGGWNFENSSGIQFPVYLSGIGYKIANSGIVPSEFLNAWHMFTGVYDRLNQKVKIYFDGVLNKETNTDSSAVIAYHSTNVIWIGAEATSSATTASNGMVGSVSDFRIYCTPLSDADIADLYHTSAKIDKSGNVHSFEFIEGSRTSITKTGAVIFPEIIEGTGSCKFSKNKIIANEFIER